MGGMRILTYNLLDGGGARLAGILALLRELTPDIAILTELNTWQTHTPGREPRVAHFARAAGFGHHALLAHSDYGVGILSRHPLVHAASLTTDVHHGILHVRSEVAHIVATHFSPNDAERRVREAAQVAALAREISEPLIVGGDLNSHSPRDAEMVAAFATAENQAWATDYRAHQTLLDAGLMDLAQASDQPLAERPTTATALKPHEPRRRLDFLYANAAFVEKYPGLAARTLREPGLAALSDHWPVLAE